MAILIGMMLTAVGFALLNKVLRDGIWSPANPMKGSYASKGRIIELDEYEIVDEIQSQPSKGCKVEIRD